MADMKFLRGYHNGLLYHVDIMESLYPGEYNMTVCTRDDMGHRCVEHSKVYKTISSALKALKRKYPDTDWEEY